MVSRVRLLLRLLRPLAQIAEELKIIRQLYEEELSTRPTPIYRITEAPSKKDTEVSYSGVVDERPLYKRWFAGEEDDEDV